MTHARYRYMLPAVVAAAWMATAAAGSARQPGAAPLPEFAPSVSHGGFVYVSAIVPSAVATKTGAPDDIRSQTVRVLDQLSATLTKAGTSLDRVVALSVYLKRAEDFPAINEVWMRYWPADPPSRTTVITGLPTPDALIQVAAVAAAPDMPRQTVHPKSWLKSPSPYSYAVRSGDTLYLAGLVARRGADNTTVKGDIAVQTRTILDNARAILEEAGFGFADVASARVFLTDVSNFAAMNDVYRSAWPADPPARATVVTGLMSADYLIEITFVAVKGGGRAAFTTPGPSGTPGTPNANLSSAIAAGGRLFLSGMLGVLPGRPPDAAGQTGEILARLGRTMALGGARWSGVLDSVVYVTDAAHAAAVLGALRAQVRPATPAGTLAVTGLVSSEARAEIMLTAGK